MLKPKILLIEDEEDIAAMIALQAKIAGYRLIVEVDGLNGLKSIEREKPDLVILDVMLPGQSGLEVCRRIKSNPALKQIPVLMISAKSEETDVLAGLEIGADDYVCKPFSLKILFSRVRVVLRRERKGENTPHNYTFGPFTIDLDSFQLRKNDTVITLTLSEFGILSRLVQNQGHVLSRNQLLDEIQTTDSFIVDRNIDVHIASLRKKLGPDFSWIETVRGVGYRFKADDF